MSLPSSDSDNEDLILLENLRKRVSQDESPSLLISAPDVGSDCGSESEGSDFRLVERVKQRFSRLIDDSSEPQVASPMLEYNDVADMKWQTKEHENTFSWDNFRPPVINSSRPGMSDRRSFQPVVEPYSPLQASGSRLPTSKLPQLKQQVVYRRDSVNDKGQCCSKVCSLGQYSMRDLSRTILQVVTDECLTNQEREQRKMNYDHYESFDPSPPPRR